MSMLYTCIGYLEPDYGSVLGVLSVLGAIIPMPRNGKPSGNVRKCDDNFHVSFREFDNQYDLGLEPKRVQLLLPSVPDLFRVYFV